jgi:hypothetical protein
MPLLSVSEIVQSQSFTAKHAPFAGLWRVLRGNQQIMRIFSSLSRVVKSRREIRSPFALCKKGESLRLQVNIGNPAKFAPEPRHITVTVLEARKICTKIPSARSYSFAKEQNALDLAASQKTREVLC